MTIRPRHCVGLVSSAIAFPLCLPLGARAQTAEVPLAPHHATYRLSLASATGSKAPAAVNGAISYDFSGSACDGYAMVFRQMTEMQPPEGEAVVSDMHSTTFEGADAKLFRFDTKTTFGGGDKEDDVDGKAIKGSDGSVSIDLQKPQPAKSSVASALFPTEHLRKIIEAAKQGQKTLSEPVYDGSETGQKFYDTFTVIGGAVTSTTEDGSAAIEALKGMRRWPVTISYFEHGLNDAQPSYIMSFELFEDGISRALKLDYGSFSLVGELQDLKLSAPAKDCKTP